jgi:hypothetical protein
VLHVSAIQKLLETSDVGTRLESSLRVMRTARDVLRLRQRLKDLAEKREPDGNDAGTDGKDMGPEGKDAGTDGKDAGTDGKDAGTDGKDAGTDGKDAPKA